MKNNFTSNREKTINLKKINRLIKFLVLIMITLLPMANSLVAQTTVFSDDFNRTTVSPGGTPSITYTTTIGAGSGQTASIPASDFLNLQNSNVAGNIYVSGLINTFNMSFNSTLSSNNYTIEWNFNSRYVRTTDPSGMGSGSYGYAIVLAGTSPAFHNTGFGYAVVYGQTGTGDPIKLVKYQNGLQGTLTTIISSGVADLSAMRNYTSVRVKYIPSTNTWALYVRDDGSSTWTNTTTTPVPDSNIKGSAIIDNTYTSVSYTMTNFGFFWNHNTTSGDKSTFDNFRVVVTPITSSQNSLTGFTYESGSGPSSSQSFNLIGTNLAGFPANITVNGTTNYEVSSDDTNFSSSINVPYTSATLSPTPVYVRLKAGLSVANYNNESITTSIGGFASGANILCSGSVYGLPTTYTWTGTTSTDWQVSTNWSPTRSTPATNDIIQFNNGVANTTTNVPTQTIAQLLLSNNTTVELQSAAPVTLTINGGTGVDFNVQSGSTLNLIQATNAISLSLGTGATGSVAGTINFGGTTHSIIAADVSSLTFQSGGLCSAGSSFGGNAFGNTNLNSVIFASGATYIQGGGSNPFGATAPNSVVIFQTGSLFKCTGTTGPSYSGRTYANFEMDQTGRTQNNQGSNPVTMDNLTVTNGTLNWDFSGGVIVKGNINVATAATLTVGNATKATTLTLSGTGNQTITTDGTLTNGANSSYVVSNTSGVNIASNVSIPTLTINSGAILNVNAGKQLTVATTLSNSGTLNLLSTGADGTATIITPTTIGGTGGTYNVKQFLTGGRNWYISSPVSGANATTVLNSSTASTKPSSFVWYDETKGSTTPWTYETSTLTVTKGYIALNPASPNPPSTDGIITFSGTLNNDTYSTTSLNPLTLSSTGVKDGFNLVGNPYPSYLDWNQITKTNINATMWYRTKESGSYKYFTYNGTAAGYGGSEIGVPANVSNLIPPMQAFWVKAEGGTGSLGFTNSMRSHRGSTNPLKAPAETKSIQQVLRLQVSNSTNTDETVLYFNPNASNEYDAFDSPKMSNNSPSIPEIYTEAGSEQLVINGLSAIPYDVEIPLGFSTLSPGEFSMKASQINNFDSGTQIVLKDYVNPGNPLITNLNDGNSYSFASGATNRTNRFSLIFHAPSVATDINSNLVESWISSDVNGNLKVNGSLNGQTSITVYNTIGQRLISKNLTSTTLNAKLPAGVYFVAVSNSGISSTKKLIVK